MEKIEFQQLRETLYHETMENGLNVYVLPKQGFHKTYATFTTKYGSIDNHFIPPGKSEVKVPDGIAHFLEHKMFEDEKEDVLSALADTVHKRTLSPALIVPHTFFQRLNISSKTCPHCLILCSTRILRRRTWTKRRGSLSRKFACTKIIPIGERISA